jgi:hypothetical protein
LAKLRVTVTATPQKVVSAVKKANVKSFAAAGAYLRGIAQRSIRRGKKASAPGTPPHTREGVMKKAIVFDVEPNSVVIGPSKNRLGMLIGNVHEFGGTEGPKPRMAPGANGFNRSKIPNWKLQVGGHGPIRTTGPKLKNGLAFAKLLHQAMVIHSMAIALREAKRAGFDLRGGAHKPRKYPARPFMAPTLAIGRQRLPDFWSNSVKSA